MAFYLPAHFVQTFIYIDDDFDLFLGNHMKTLKPARQTAMIRENATLLGRILFSYTPCLNRPAYFTTARQCRRS
jgi:hypothetical protein